MYAHIEHDIVNIQKGSNFQTLFVELVKNTPKPGLLKQDGSRVFVLFPSSSGDLATLQFGNHCGEALIKESLV